MKNEKIYNLKSTKEKRKLLRYSSTESEVKLWDKLRGKRLQGLNFFRQYGIGHYIADFYCPQLKLVVEVDGDKHFTEDGIAYDEERSRFFAASNIKTLRFRNQDVLKNIEKVLITIQTCANQRTSSLGPPLHLKRGNGGV